MKKRSVIIVILALALIAVCILIFTNQGKEEKISETPETPATESIKQDEAEDSDRFSGVVLDGLTKQPLAAKITVKDKERVVQTVNCNDSGEYTLSLADGEYQISAEYPGYVPKGRYDMFQYIEVDGEPDASQTIMLWPEAQVKGRVVSGDEGIVSELRFGYQYDDSDAEKYLFKTISSDASGAFLLKGAYGGVQNIEITADGFVKQKLKNIKLEPGKTVDLGDIPMRTGVTVYGVVTDAATGKAIEGAKLRYTDRTGKVLMEATSQADGAYKLPATDMQNVQIAVIADGYKDIYDRISLPEQQKYEYDVTMTKLTGIGVIVNNQTGRDPIKTLVTVTDIASEKVVYEHEFDNGFYTLDDLREGPYLVRGVSADKLTEVSARALFGSTVTLNLKPFAKINAQFIIKKNKEPAKGTYRYIFKPEDGGEESSSNWTPIPGDMVTIDNLMPGTYWIEARSDSIWERVEDNPTAEKNHISRSHAITLAMGETSYVKLALTTGGTLRGKITVPPRLAGQKLDYKIVEKVEDGGFSMVSVDDGIDENGEFVQHELPKGEFGVYIFAEDGSASYFSDIKLDADSDFAMNFDMTHSRKQTSDGVSLSFPIPLHKDMDKSYTGEEAKELSKKIKQWQDAIQEQEKYQQNASVQRQELNTENDTLDDSDWLDE